MARAPDDSRNCARRQGPWEYVRAETHAQVHDQCKRRGGVSRAPVPIPAELLPRQTRAGVPPGCSFSFFSVKSLLAEGSQRQVEAIGTCHGSAGVAHNPTSRFESQVVRSTTTSPAACPDVAWKPVVLKTRRRVGRSSSHASKTSHRSSRRRRFAYADIGETNFRASVTNVYGHRRRSDIS